MNTPSIARRIPITTLERDAATLKFLNQTDANQYVLRTYRKGLKVKGLLVGDAGLRKKM